MFWCQQSKIHQVYKNAPASKSQNISLFHFVHLTTSECESLLEARSMKSGMLHKGKGLCVQVWQPSLETMQQKQEKKENVKV